MDEQEEKTLANIEEYGCSILHVFSDDGDPPFSYSIGITKKTEQPEIIVTGLKRELAHRIINEYNTRVREGEIFSEGERYKGFLKGFDVEFRVVSKEHYRKYFGWALWLYGEEPFVVLQMIFPSTSNVWPWDKDAADKYLWAIPKLYGTSAKSS